MKTDIAELVASLRGLDAHRQARDELKARLAAIDTEAAGQAFDDDAKAEFEATAEAIQSLDGIIAELEVREATIKTLTTAPVASDRIERPFSGPNINKTPDNVFDLAAYRERARSVSELPGLYRDGAMRILEQATFPTAKDQAAARTQAAAVLAKHRDDIGEFGGETMPGAVGRRMIATQDPLYREAFAAYLAGGEKRMSPRLMAVLQTGSDSDGGFAIPFTIDPTFILTTSGAASAIRARSRVETITTKSWHPLTTEGVTASYGTETAAATDVAPSDIDDLNGVTPIRAKAFVKYTAEYQEDYGPAAILAQVGALIRDAKDILEAEKFILGNGSGEPEGVVWKLDDDTTSLVSTSNLDLDAIDGLTAALGPRFRMPDARGGASYMANLAILQKIRQLGEAGFPANSIYDPLSKVLNGYPADEASYMDDVWTTGKEVLLFGDFGDGFVIVDRIGLSVEYVPQVFDGSGDPLGQRGVYARWRNTSKVITVNAFRLLTHS